MGKPTLIMDLDGTMILCGVYYDQATQRGAEYLAQVTGFSVEACFGIIRALDLVAIQLPDGFKADRFPQSFEAAALALCHVASLRKPDVVPYGPKYVTAGEIGRSVFDAPYEIFPHVKETLAALKQDWQLILYTKGDADVQRHKIEMHGFAACFDHCVITPKKDDATLQRLLREFDVDVAQSWMIGDSERDDIAVAQRAGMRTILTIEDNHHWAYNDADVKPTVVVTQFAQILDDLQQDARERGSTEADVA